MIPAESDAKRDTALRGVPIAVYNHLLDVLHPNDWREVKQLSVAAALGISDRHLRRALNVLTELRYLERQPYRHDAPRLYRLVYSRPAVAPIDSRHPQDPAA
jgi:hypothetical protein